MRNPNSQPGRMYIRNLYDPANPKIKYVVRVQEHIDPANYHNSSVTTQIYNGRTRRWEKTITLEPHAARHIMATLKAQDTRKQPPAQDHL